MNIDTETLRNDKDNIQYVVHLSDIHIRKDKRFDEYRTVFNRLNEQLMKLKLDNTNSVIVVTGDIIHDKNTLTGESVNLLKDFYLGLCEITTTITILGNHDKNMNADFIDTIYPVIGKAFQTKYPVHILLENKTYRYNNLLFGVTTMESNKITLCRRINKNMTKIGLYHGMVTGGVMGNGMKIQNEKFCVRDFTCRYDITMLGDIHKHQYLNKNKTIAYSGSLIQQNRGESLEKGFILWDVTNKSSEFIRVWNDYGMVDVIINQDGINNLSGEIMPHNLDVKVICESSDPKLVEVVYKKLEDDGYNIVSKDYLLKDVNYNVTMNLKNGEEKNILDFRNEKAVLELFQEYINDNSEENDDMKNKILNKLQINIRQVINNKGDKIRECKDIKLLELSFDNLIIYQKDNFINFANLKNVIGLSGGTNIGKSSVIDILIFSIYGSCLRGSKGDYINNSSKKFNSVIKLQANGVLYKIERSGCRGIKKNGQFYMREEKGFLYKDNINISKNSITETNRFIEQEICTCKEFMTTSIILQSNDKHFIGMSKNDKLALLCDITKIDIFGKILNIEKTNNTSLHRNFSLVKKELKKYHKYGATMEAILKTIDLELEIIKAKYKKIEKEIVAMNEEKENLMKKKTEIETEIRITDKNINYDNCDKKAIKKDLQATRNMIEKNEDIKKKLVEKKDCILKKISVIGNIDDVKEKFESDKENEILTLNEQLENIYSNLVNIEETDFIYIKKEHDRLINDKNVMENEILELEKNILVKTKRKPIKRSMTKKKYEECVEMEKDLAEMNKNIERIKESAKIFENQLKDYDNHNFDPNCKFCVENSITKHKVKLESELAKINKNIIKQTKLRDEIGKYISDNKKMMLIFETNEKNKIYNCKLDKSKDKMNGKILLIKESLFEVKKKLEIYDRHQERDEIVKNNNKLKKEIKKIKDTITTVRSKKCCKIVEYNKLKNDKKKIKKQINEIDDIIISNYNTQTELETQLETIIEQERNLSAINKLKEELRMYNTQLDTIERKIKKNINDKNDCAFDGLEREYENIQNLKIKYNKMEDDTIVSDKIMKILGNSDGIVDEILIKKIIPKLEDTVNQILENIEDFKIKINFTKTDFGVYKCNNTRLEMNGGYVNHLLNMVFMVALAKINSNTSTNFIMVDEAFDNCDNIGKSKITKFIDHMKTIFDFVLIISHNDDIKLMFDKVISIENVNGKSKIFVK